MTPRRLLFAGSDSTMLDAQQKTHQGTNDVISMGIGQWQTLSYAFATAAPGHSLELEHTLR